MEHHDLLLSLRRRGMRLWLENGELHFLAPKGALSQEELQQLRTRKAELIGLLDPVRLDIPLLSRASGSIVPLTVEQELWRTYINERQSGLTDRLCYVAMRVSGPLDPGRLWSSVQGLQQRHESLRTRIVVDAGIARQQVDTSSEVPLEIVDLSLMSAANALTEVLRLGHEFVTRKVELGVGPLFGVQLLQLPDGTHVVIMALEHIIGDDVSLSILHRELWTFYRMHARGTPCSLLALRVQFPDYAVWQQQTYDSWLLNHAAYWREHLTGVRSIRLPRDGAGLDAGEPTHATVTVRFSAAVAEGLREVARQQRTLLALVFLTIYVTAVARWCEQRDFVLWFISNGRYRSELEGMVGALVDRLPLQVEITEQDTFVSLLQRLAMDLRSAYEHQDFGRILRLVPECAPELDFNWTSTHWMWEPIDPDGAADGSLGARPFALEVAWPRPFVPLFFDTPNGIIATLTYQASAFTERTIERLAGDLVSLAQKFAHRPEGLLCG